MGLTVAAVDTGAVVLCGGASRRMGRDKASLPFGDETLLDRIVRIVTPCVDEVRLVAREGQVLLVTDATGAGLAGADAQACLVLPDVDPFLAPILYSIPAQLIAYHTAVHKGTDVDQPRNLAKSVTVE